MSESGGFNEDNDLPGGSFSRLLLSTDNNNNNSSFQVFSQPQQPLFSSNTPNMLCFGDFSSQVSPSFTSHYNNDTSYPSSFGNAITLLNNKRRSGSGQQTGFGLESGHKNGRKKNKPEMGPTITNTTTTLVGHAKRKKEKLGERIAALQQLVCPYGKTDTASVLHEATGYIKFLQDQVKVLSSPYLQQPLPCSSSPQHSLSEKSASTTEKAYDTTKCLRSRGLCLIPVDYIIDLANTNGADFWSYSTSSSGP